VSDVWVYPIDAVVEELECCDLVPYPPWLLPFYGPYELDNDDDDKGWIIFSLINRRIFTDDPSRCDARVAPTHLVGMVHPSIETGSLLGYANYVWNVSFVKMVSNPAASGNVPFVTPLAGSVFAQELSHNYNGAFGSRWEHVACGTTDSVNPSYPYPPCQIAPTFSQQTFWGFDTLTETPIAPAAGPGGSPARATDYMSYGRRPWVSDYTWRGMQSELTDVKSTSSSAMEARLAYSEVYALKPAGITAHPACTDGIGDCCAAAGNGTAACDEEACCNAVCACDSFCCDVEWDSFCATTGVGTSGCGADILCSSCVDAENLLVLGGIRTSDDLATIRQAYRLPDGLLSPTKVASLLAEQAEITGPNSPFRLELVAADGSVLASQPFDTPASSDEWPSDYRMFALWVPYDPLTAEMRVMRDGAILGRRTVSPNAPMLTILSPEPSDVIDTPLTVEWQASDPDGDALLFTVQYTPDNGGNWLALATDVPSGTGPSTVLTLDVPTLPGSATPSAPGSSLIRVIASDGVNTGVAVAGPFTVLGRSPLPHISTPRDGQIYHHSAQILLSGRAIDPEDGVLEDASLEWFVDGSPVGTGEELALPGLPPGTYAVTLAATDTDAQQGFDGVTIVVGGGATPADPDSDGDGYVDDEDNCPRHDNSGQEDGDGDGVGDLCDTCPGTPDPGQTDSDVDGVGDACDPCPSDSINDPDGDGACGWDDNCPSDLNADQADADGDGVGDTCDNCPGIPNADQSDCNGNAVGDPCEIAQRSQADCNNNAFPDDCDIMLGQSIDLDGDSVPDECKNAAPAGEVPDGWRLSGLPLTVEKLQGDDLLLSWDLSCGGNDFDFAIYQGVIGSYYRHRAYTCSTGGQPLAVVSPGPEDSYFLVVPLSTGSEGSYGVDGFGNERPQALPSCAIQALGACP
jgi:hypothetical protein